MGGGLNLVETMRTHDVNKIIFSSSAATYGEPLHTPIEETHPQNPTNPYGETKLMFEKILKWYDVAYGTKSFLALFQRLSADPDAKIVKITILNSISSDSAANRFGAEEKHQGIRHGLGHAGRHVHPRLYPHS